MRTAIKLIFCLAIFFACQTKELSAQVINNTAGTFPAPDGLTLEGTAQVPMSLAKATERYNNYYQVSPVEGWTVDNKIIRQRIRQNRFIAHISATGRAADFPADVSAASL